MFKTQKMGYLLNNKLNKNIVREEEKTEWEKSISL
jgi:hypothetical protein